jgi:hypothetical protein
MKTAARGGVGPALHPRNKFAPDEDMKLVDLVGRFGESRWWEVSKQLPGRNARQCRDRWLNYLSPKVINQPWTDEEERELVAKHSQFGPLWRHIATFFPGRTDINIKSHWLLMQRRIRRSATDAALSKPHRQNPASVFAAKEPDPPAQINPAAAGQAGSIDPAPPQSWENGLPNPGAEFGLEEWF